MELNLLLLKIVQFTAVSTFLIFLLFVFIPKIRNNKNKSFKTYFFKDKLVFKSFFILFCGYLFLLSHLFIFNSNYSHIGVYIIGFILSLIGLIVAIVGRLQLRKIWNPISNIYDSKAVLDTGIFSKIRHPIYVGRFMFFLGVMLMFNLLAIFIAPYYWDYLRNRIVEEEKYLLKINPKYKKYMEKVSRIIF